MVKRYLSGLITAGQESNVQIGTSFVSKMYNATDATQYTNSLFWPYQGWTPAGIPAPTLIPIEILVVSGGGAGGPGKTGNWEGGGGGAGGVLYTTSNVYTSATHTITVGAGGTSSPSATAWVTAIPAANGSNSSIIAAANIAYRLANSIDPDTIITYNNFISSVGGGSGGGYPPATAPGVYLGSPGGSGGANYASGAGQNGTAPTGIPGQGNPAGNSFGAGQSGGGGGAGAAGSNAPPTTKPPTATPGGAGRSINITGTSQAYGGGGAGSGLNWSGTAGQSPGGGGGWAGGTLPGSQGGKSLGGGGGGGLSDTANVGGYGGAGVVIIRHANSYGTANVTGSNVIVAYEGANVYYKFIDSGTILW